MSSFRTDNPTHDSNNSNRRRKLVRRSLAASAAGAAIFAGSAGWSLSASASPAGHLSAAHIKKIRLSALHWAEHQRGKWYCWGGDGPSCYDCSGLVMAAYRHAGIDLPHSTYAMLDSGLLKRVSKADRRPGDLAFYGTGHVELVTRYGTFGAADTGSQVGYHDANPWWYPTMYFEIK